LTRDGSRDAPRPGDGQDGPHRGARRRGLPLTAVNLAATLGILVLVALSVQPENAGTAPAGPLAVGAGYAAGAPPAPPATTPTGAPPPPAGPAIGPLMAGAGAPPPGGAADPTGAADPLGTAAPARIRIPDIGVDAPLEALHLLPDGNLAAPRAWEEAGWYADGTRPGEIGPAVIAGHIDSTHGPAVFFRLDRLRPGARIEVERAGRWLSFRAVSIAEYPKNAFPTAEVYGPTPDPQLRLITCGGAFDRGHGSYLDNTVVYAVAAA
jgi:hypothetical protein